MSSNGDPVGAGERADYATAGAAINALISTGERITRPFTPEQEVALRQMMREEVDLGVTAGVGDMARILRCLDYLRTEFDLGRRYDRAGLIEAGTEVMALVNSESGMTLRLEAFRRRWLGDGE